MCSFWLSSCLHVIAVKDDDTCGIHITFGTNIGTGSEVTGITLSVILLSCCPTGPETQAGCYGNTGKDLNFR